MTTYNINQLSKLTHTIAMQFTINKIIVLSTNQSAYLSAINYLFAYMLQINEILADDKELAAEILHDLQNSGELEEDEEDGRPEIGSEEVLKQAMMEVVALNEARKSLNTSKRASVTHPGSTSKRLSASPPGNFQDLLPSTSKTPPSNSLSGRLDSPNSTPQVNGKHYSPSSSSSKSESPGTSSELGEERKSLPNQRSNRNSTCSTNSDTSSHSKSSKSSRKSRKKR